MNEINDKIMEIVKQQKLPNLTDSEIQGLEYELSKDLPKNPLPYVEQLIIDDIFNLKQARVFLRINPIPREDIKQIIKDSKEDMYEEYGLLVPDYMLLFMTIIDEEGKTSTGGNVCFITRTMGLFEHQDIYMPLTVAHEQAHTSMMEHSILYNEIKKACYAHEFYKRWGGKEDYNAVRSKEEENKLHNQARYIIEGWAKFVEGLYAEIKDRKFGGKSIYRDIFESEQDRLINEDKEKGNEKNAPYYEGKKLFDTIFERGGMEEVFWAAGNLVTNEDLIKFANK